MHPGHPSVGLSSLSFALSFTLQTVGRKRTPLHAESEQPECVQQSDLTVLSSAPETASSKRVLGPSYPK